MVFPVRFAFSIVLSFGLIFPQLFSEGFAHKVFALPLEQSDDPLEPAWFLVGGPSDSIGEALSGIGDVNGDGYDDAVVLLFDDFLVYFGSEEGLSLEPSLTGTQVGPSGSFYPGSVAAAGDVNGDGFGDMLVGDPFRDSEEKEGVGAVRLFYGGATGFDNGQPWQALGTETDAQFGYAVDGAGDLNGDGFSDVVVAAPGTFDGSLPGVVYLFYGAADGLNQEPQLITAGDARVARFGTSVSGAGDLNGDGFDDLIVGGGDADRVYVYFGSDEGVESEPAAQLLPEEYDYIFADGVDGIGDVNGDGFDDLVVDAANIDDTVKAYVFYGSAEGPAEVPDQRIVLLNPDGYDGRVAAAGDLNGDGYMDLGVSLAAPSYLESGSGTLYLYYGGEDGLAAEASGQIGGSEIGDEFGAAFSSAGDVNGDGFHDILIGAPSSTEGGNYAGKAYLYLGSDSGVGGGTQTGESDSGETQSRALAELTAPESGALYGYQAVGAGDVNGDGYVDVLVTSLNAARGRGAAYLYFGSAGGLAVDPDWTAEGEARREDFGYLSGPAGDLNGDGFADIFVSAPFYDGGVGKVYVYYGGEDGPSDSANWWFTGANEDSLAGIMAAGVGDVNGDGYGDMAVVVQVTTAEDSVINQMVLYHGGEEGLGEEPAFATASDADFGAFVEAAGDVNGDGYADVILAPSLDGEVPGSLGVLHGGAEGLNGTIVFFDEGENAGDYYGYDATGIGDVNGDGYDDLVVGAPGVDDAVGAVQLYLGGEAGLEADWAWRVQGAVPNGWFGTTVAALGDVNGDGYADFAIGEAENSEGPSLIYIYLGGSDGPADEPVFVHESELRELYDWGIRISSVGDLDGDGADDFLVGEPGYPDGGEDGRVSIFALESPLRSSVQVDAVELGQMTGWNPSREQVLDEGKPGEAYGWQTIIVRDLNGDGFDELAVASFGNPDLGMSGRLAVYFGSIEGVMKSADWEAGPADWPAVEDQDGNSVTDLGVFNVASLGDANGDDYNDLAVAIASTTSDASRILAYYGSAEGLASEPDWIVDATEPFAEIAGIRLLGLGDVNGDGFGDMGVISIPSSADDAGRFSFYYGSDSGFSTEPDVTRTIPMSQDYLMDLAAVGDLNDDGFDDVVVGLPFTEVGDVSQINVLLGSEDGIDLTQVWEADSEVEGGTLGLRVAGLGDVNGDGAADFATTELIDGSSRVVVYLNGDELTEQGISGANGILLGTSLGGIGDINGDGYQDLVASATNEAEAEIVWQIFAGSAEGINPSPLYEHRLRSEDPFFTFFLNFLPGDLDGDGYDDFAVADLDFASLQEGDDVTVPIRIFYGGMMSEDASPEVEDANDEAIDPTTLAESFWQVGTEMLLSNELNDALVQFELAIEANSDFAPAHNGRGRVYLIQEQYEEALENFDRAVYADPELWQAWFNRGTVYYVLEQYEEALVNLSEAAYLAPDYADTYYWRGFTYLALEDAESAISDFQTFLELDPESAEKEEVEAVLADLR